mgnify:CR=1 FL=1
MATREMDLFSPLKTRFAEDGYLVLRQVLAPETIQHVHAFLNSQMTDAIDAACQQLGLASRDAFVEYANRAVKSSEIAGFDKLTRDVMTGHYPLEVRLSRELWAIPRDAGLRNVLAALLESDTLFMHMPPTARFVLPGNAQAGVPAHQDAIYNEHMQGFITVWVPFVTIDDRCGGVAVYPGSGSVKHAASHDQGNFWYDAAPTEGLEKLHVHCAPGDILVMNNHVIHESMPNVSDRTRVSVDLRFFGASGWSRKHYLDMQDWHVVAPTEA